jgi:drug/metabolite transporter (DMT)-like permease
VAACALRARGKSRLSSTVSEAQAAVGRRTAYALAAAAMVVWGSPPVVTRAVSADVPPFALAFARWFIAALILAPFVWRKLPAEWAEHRGQRMSLLKLSVFMTAGSTLSIVAVYFTTATNAVLVNASQPAITAAIAWLVARERLSGRQALGIGAAFAGILVMICRGDPAVLLSLDVNVGDLIMLAAVVGWALYAVHLHRRERLPSGDVLLFLISMTGASMLLPLSLIEQAWSEPIEPGAGIAAAMVYLALFPSLLATYFWNRSLKSLGANRAAIFVNLIPISGAALAMIFLGERLFAYHLAGAAFVFVGIYLSARR